MSSHSILQRKNFASLNEKICSGVDFEAAWKNYVSSNVGQSVESELVSLLALSRQS